MKRILLAFITAFALMFAPTTATATIAPPRDAPTNLTATNITATSATLTWNPPAGGQDVSGYRVTWLIKHKVAGTKNTTADVRSATLDKLTPSTTYTAKVAAVTKRHPIGRAATLTFTTSKDPKLAPSAYALTKHRNSEPSTLLRAPVAGGVPVTIDTGVSDFVSFPGGVVYTTGTQVKRHDGAGTTVLGELDGATLVGGDDAGNAYLNKAGTLSKLSHDGNKSTLISGATDVKSFGVAPNGLVMAIQDDKNDSVKAFISIVKDGTLTDTRHVLEPYPYFYSLIALSSGDALMFGSTYRPTALDYYTYIPAGSSTLTRLETRLGVINRGTAPDESIYIGATDRYCMKGSGCPQDYTTSTISKYVAGKKVATINVKGYTMIPGSNSLDAAANGQIFAATSTPKPQLVAFDPTGGEPDVLADLSENTDWAKIEVN